MNVEFKELYKDILEAIPMTDKDICDLTGITPSVMSKIKRDDVQAKQVHMKKMEKFHWRVMNVATRNSSITKHDTTLLLRTLIDVYGVKCNRIYSYDSDLQTNSKAWCIGDDTDSKIKKMQIALKKMDVGYTIKSVKYNNISSVRLIDYKNK